MTSRLTPVIEAIVHDVVAAHVIDAKDVAKEALADIDLDRLIAGAGVRTRDMTRDERRARKERLNDDARRKRQARKKLERTQHEADHAAAAQEVDDTTLREGLTIVAPTVQQIDKVVNHFGRRFATTIGRAHLHEVAISTLDDLGRMVMIDDKHQPDTYRIGCLYVATLPGIPDVPRGAPAAASRFVAMMKRRARFNLIDWHRANPTLISLEHLETMAASLNMGADNFLAKGADLNRNPFPLPAHTDTMFMRCVVDAAIEEMTVNGESVGWLIDTLLDEAKRDNVGRFDWVHEGRAILDRLGMPVWPELSAVLVGMYAMRATQKVLRLLPAIIHQVIYICADARLVARYFGPMPHHDRVRFIKHDFPSRYELSNDRKAIIIPEHGTTEQLNDLYAELDTGLTKAQRSYKKATDDRARRLVKIASEIPTEFLVSEIQAVLADLVDLERELV